MSIYVFMGWLQQTLHTLVGIAKKHREGRLDESPLRHGRGGRASAARRLAPAKPPP